MPAVRLIQELVAAGVLAAGVGGGFLLADEPLEVALHNKISTNTTHSFSTAKKRLFTEVDRRSDDTVRCRYSGVSMGLVPDGNFFKPDPDEKIQVEHTWPSKANWADTSDHFNRESSLQGADLHHLFATRGSLNGSRGDLPFGELPPNARELRLAADHTIEDDDPDARNSGSFRDRNAAGELSFEPRQSHKGDAARATFYMSVRYEMPIPEPVEDDLRLWHDQDPPTGEERTRNNKIEAIQGNRNPFVDFPELVHEIENF